MRRRGRFVNLPAMFSACIFPVGVAGVVRWDGDELEFGFWIFLDRHAARKKENETEKPRIPLESRKTQVHKFR